MGIAREVLGSGNVSRGMAFGRNGPKGRVGFGDRKRGVAEFKGVPEPAIYQTPEARAEKVTGILQQRWGDVLQGEFLAAFKKLLLAELSQATASTNHTTLMRCVMALETSMCVPGPFDTKDADLLRRHVRSVRDAWYAQAKRVEELL